MTESKPNILFILVDQMRADCLSCLGHPVIKTPHLDSLAADGTLFNQAYTQGPICVPARMSLFTGLYVHQHGCIDNNRALWPSTPNFVRQLRESGYTTANRGKLHLFWRHDNELLLSDGMLKHFGFDDPLETSGKCSNGKLRASAYTEFLRRHGKLDNYWAWLCNLVASRPTNVSFAPSILSEEEHIDGWVIDQGRDYLRKSSNQKHPFFLWIGPPGPHDPFDPPEKWATLYDPLKVDLPIRSWSEDPLARIAAEKKGTANISENILRKMRALYYGNVSFIDSKIGQMLSDMKKADTYDNTWIVFTSDHGEMLGDFHCTSKTLFHEQSARIPLIVKPPKAFSTKRGNISDALVELTDVSATFLDIAGTTLEHHEGKSLLPLLNDDFSPTPLHTAVHSQMGEQHMIYDGRYKLITRKIFSESNLEFQNQALFDLKNDPSELKSVLLQKQDEAKRLIDKELVPFFARTSYKLKTQWDKVAPYDSWKEYPLTVHLDQTFDRAFPEKFNITEFEPSNNHA
jgi:arylsulfatase